VRVEREIHHLREIRNLLKSRKCREMSFLKEIQNFSKKGIQSKMGLSKTK